MTLPDRQSCNLEHPDSVRAWQFIQDLMWTDHSTMKPDAHAEQVGFPALGRRPGRHAAGLV